LSDIAGETISGSASATGVSAAGGTEAISPELQVDITFTVNRVRAAADRRRLLDVENCNISTRDCTSSFTGSASAPSRATKPGSSPAHDHGALVYSTQNLTVTFNYTVSSTPSTALWR